MRLSTALIASSVGRVDRSVEVTLHETKWRAMSSNSNTSEGRFNERKRPVDQSGGDGRAGECVVAEKRPLTK